MFLRIVHNKFQFQISIYIYKYTKLAEFRCSGRSGHIVCNDYHASLYFLYFIIYIYILLFYIIFCFLPIIFDKSLLEDKKQK